MSASEQLPAPASSAPLSPAFDFEGIFGVDPAQYEKGANPAQFEGLTAQLGDKWTSDQVAQTIARAPEAERADLYLGSDPDAIAKAWELADAVEGPTVDVLRAESKRLQIPETAVYDLMKQKKWDELKTRGKMIAVWQNPNSILARRAMDPAQLHRFKDDAEALARLEGALQENYGTPSGRWWHGFKGGVGSAVAGAANIPVLAAGIGSDTADFEVGAYEKHIKDLLPSSIEPSVTAALKFGQEQYNLLSWGANQAAENAGAYYEKVPLNTGSPVIDTLREATSRGIPQVSAYLGLAAVTSPIAAAAVFGSEDGGRVWRNLQQAGVSPEDRLLAAAAATAVSTGLNAVQIDRWAKLFGAKGPLAKAAAHNAGEIGIQGVVGIAQPMAIDTIEVGAKLADLPQYGAMDALAELSAKAPGWFESGINSAIMTGMVGAPSMVRGVFGEARQQRAFRLWGKMAEAAKGQKIENPAAAKELVGEMAKKAGVEVAYVRAEDIEKLYQGREAELDAMLEATGLRSEFERSKAGGSDMRVPVADFTVSMADKPDADAIRREFKLAPDGQTVAEREEQHKILQEQQAEWLRLRGKLDEFAAKGELPEAVKVFRQDLLAAGHDSEAATQAAEMLFAAARIAAKRKAEKVKGYTVEDWLADQNVRAIMSDQVANVADMRRQAEEIRAKARPAAVAADAVPAADAAVDLAVAAQEQGGDLGAAPRLAGHNWNDAERNADIVAHIAETKDLGYLARARASLEARLAEVESARSAARGPNNAERKTAREIFDGSPESIAFEVRKRFGRKAKDQITKEEEQEIEVLVHRVMEDRQESVNGIPAWMQERFAEFMDQAMSLAQLSNKEVKSERSARIRDIAEKQNTVDAGNDAEIAHLESVRDAIERAAEPETSSAQRIADAYAEPVETAPMQQDAAPAPEMVRVDPLTDPAAEKPWANELVDGPNGVKIVAGKAAELLAGMDQTAAAPFIEALRGELAARGYDVAVKEHTAEEYYQPDLSPNGTPMELPRGIDHVDSGDKEAIRALAESVIGSKSGGPRQGVTYGKVMEGDAAKIKEKTGLDVSGYSHVIDNFGIKHAMKGHGDPKQELARGQIAITAEDFALVPEVTRPENLVGLEKSRQGLPALIYKKEIGGNLVVIEEVRAKRGHLALLSMRKMKAGAYHHETMAGDKGRPKSLNARGDGTVSPSSDGTVSPDAAPVKPESYEQSARDRAAAALAKAKADQEALRARVRANLEKAKALVTPEVEWQAMNAYLVAVQRQAAGLEAFGQGDGKEGADVSAVVSDMLREDGIDPATPSATRGSVEFHDGATIIRIVKGKADLSTVLHELGHVFIRDLQKSVEAGIGGEKAAADLKILTDFAGGKFDREGIEKIARAWEGWLREGKAPSAELGGAFERFQGWLTAIYKDIKAYVGADMNDEVRGVFERMVASEREIAEAEAYYETRTRLENMAGVTEQERQLLAARRVRAREATAGKGASRAVGEYLRALGGKKAFREQAEREIGELAAMRALDEFKALGGVRRGEVEAVAGKAVADAIEAAHGADSYGTALGIEAIESIAKERGYASGEAMLADLAKTANRKLAVDGRVKEIIEGHTAAAKDILKDGGATAADDAYHNDARLLLLEAELKIMRRQATKKEGQRAKIVNLRAIRDAAKKLVSEGSVRDAGQHARFSAAERRAAADAMRAAAEGDWEAAARFKEQQLFNHALVLESIAARAEAMEFRRRYGDRKLAGTINRMESRYREAFKDMLTTFGLTTNPKMRPDNPGQDISIPSASDAPDAGGVPAVVSFLPDLKTVIPDWIKRRIKPEGFADWRDLTVGQLRELDDALQAMAVSGRGSLRALQNQYGQTIDELAQESIRRMNPRQDRPKLRDTDVPWNRVLNWMDKFWAGLVCPENQADMWDGNPSLVGQEYGPIRKAFIAIRACELKQGKLLEEMTAKIQPHLDVLAQARARLTDAKGGESFDIDGLPVPQKLTEARGHAKWNAERLLMLVFNTGNDANLFALMNSYGFDAGHVAKMRSMFTAKEWEAIQGVWDAIDTIWPELEAVTFRLTNKHIKKEMPQEFTTTTADGHEITVRGGYFPLKYDGLVSERMGQVQEFNELKDFAAGMQAVHGSASPEKGMATERARDKDGNPIVKQPPLLQLKALTDHIYKATRYISMAEALHDFDSMTRHEQWRDTFQRKFGQAAYATLRLWLNRQANPHAANNGFLWSIFEKLRGFETVRVLGLNVKTALKQRLGYFNAAAAMSDASRTGASGWTYLMRGVGELGFGGNLGALSDKIRWIHEQSQYMKERDKGAERELRDRIATLEAEGRKTINLGGKEYALSDIKDAMFFWIRMNDRGTASAVWLGAYQQARAGDAGFDIAGLTNEQAHAKAVEFADSMAATQASGFTADLSLMQTDPIWRFFTMFMSGVIRQGSRLYQTVDAAQIGQVSKGRVARMLLMEMAMPAWAGLSIYSAMIYAASGGTDEKDLPKWWEWLFEPTQNAVAWIPGLRDVGGTLRYGGRSGRGLGQMGGDVTAAWGHATEGETAAAVWDLWKATEYAIRLPISNVVRQAQQADKVLSGGEE